MFRKRKESVSTALAHLSPGERRRLFWRISPLLMIDFLMPALHEAGVPFGLTLVMQALALIGMLWLFVRALRKANNGK